jgi:Domain of unknown function (DUF5069)
MNTKRLRALAPDLNRTAPRSPRAPLGEDFPALAARLVDKCRAELAGLGGSYQYNCLLDRRFFAATGLEAGRLRGRGRRRGRVVDESARAIVAG